MIFLLAPLLNMIWFWQSRRGSEPTSIRKMALGYLIAGASFLVMVVATQGIGPEGRGSVAWLLGSVFILTIGELYLSPVGLSLVTKVAPARIISMMMGLWFLSSFFGNYFAGFLGTFWERMPQAAFFLMLTGLGIGGGVAIWVFGRPMERVVEGHDRAGSPDGI
jgi:POT family proton-dependent oligopeptide transporter